MNSIARKIESDILEKNASKLEGGNISLEENIKALIKCGYWGLLQPRIFGGGGETYLNYIMVMEEFSKHCVNTALTYSVHNIFSRIINKYGTEDQKKRYLPACVNGEKLGAVCIAESTAGSDVGGMNTYYVKEGRGIKLVGRKVFVSSGGLADSYIVFARSLGTKRKDGLSCFLVEKNAKGLEFGRTEKKMGLNGSPTREVILDNCIVTPHDRVGEENEGFTIISEGLAEGRISIGAMCVGLAYRALNEALLHSKKSAQSNRPLSSFQVAQTMLADMSILLQASRLLVWQAAVMLDRGEDFSLAASRAKTFASDVVVRITNDAVQILGEHAYMKDSNVERYMRQAKLFQIAEGTNEVQRMLIAKKILN